MRDISVEEQAARAERVVIPRSLVYIWAKNRDTGAEEEMGFWNGVGNYDFQVYDGLTGSTETRTFTGCGSLLSVDNIQLAMDLSVRTVNVGLSQIDENVAQAIRGYDARNARIEIYCGLLNIENQQELVAPARARFVGFVDQAVIATPAEGGTGSITLSCVSCTRELTRVNSDVRSDESQQRRYAGDRFFKDVGVTGQIEVFWGQARGDPAKATSAGGIQWKTPFRPLN